MLSREPRGSNHVAVAKVESALLDNMSSDVWVLLPKAVGDAVNSFTDDRRSGSLTLQFKEGRIMAVDKREVARI